MNGRSNRPQLGIILAMGRILDRSKAAGRILFDILCDFGDIALEADFFLTRKGMYRLAHDSPEMHGRFRDDLHSLIKGGYIKREKNDTFLVTPKGRKQMEFLRIRAKKVCDGRWDRKWRIVIFDIPEKMRRERAALRSFLRRNGFVRLQNSVFVAPFANMDALDFIRREYKIEKYVNFIIGETDRRENDSLLRKKFGLA